MARRPLNMTFGVAGLLNEGQGQARFPNLRIHDLMNAGNSGAHEANARIQLESYSQLGSYCSRADRSGDSDLGLFTTSLAFEKSLPSRLLSISIPPLS
jgi:hypothetical protein